MLSARAVAGILIGSPSVSAASGSPRPAAPAGGSSRCTLRISTSRSASRVSISTVSSASERATSASSLPGSRTEPPLSTVASTAVRRPRSRSVAESVTEPSPASIKTPDRAWVAARVETARETVESLETSSSRLVVSFKRLPCRVGLGAVEKPWDEDYSAVSSRKWPGDAPVDGRGFLQWRRRPGTVVRQPAVGLWIAVRNSATFSVSASSSSRRASMRLRLFITVV